MNDIFLDWGNDIDLGPTGDLAMVSDSAAVSQRICRRLLTNVGDYLWHLDYGASLGSFVGRPAVPDQIEGVIRSQLALEASVPTSPPPAVSVTLADKANGIITANITYADPVSLAPASLAVSASSAPAP